MTETDSNGETAPTEADPDAGGADPEATDESAADGEDELESDEREEERTETDDRTLGVGLITIANDRSLEADPAGEAIVTGFKKADHEVVTREHIGSDHDRVQSIVSRMLDRDDVDVIVTGGATSVEPSDITIEAVEPLLDKRLTAFGELFTSLAYEAVGTRVLAARTIAGVTEGTPVFCLPGNADAARLALGEIILPELHTLVALAREEIPQDKWAVDADTDADAADIEAPGDGGERDTDGETPSDAERGGE